MKKIFFWLFVLSVLTNTSCVFGQRIRFQSNAVVKTITVNGTARSFRVFVPTNLPKEKKNPLVFVFHGGGSDAIDIENYTGFSVLAEREKFIAVYPDGIDKNWNDGRELVQTDDLAFVKAMLDLLVKEYGIDEKRIFSTGISNGGFFSNYIAANLSDKFAAIAPVVGGIAEPFAPKFAPKEPISVFIIQGTEDPLVPYNGGQVAKNRGRTISTDQTIELWTKHNQTAKSFTKAALPDTDKTDGCTVETYLWSGGKNGTEVKFYKEIGGGHTFASAKQYLPKFIIGNVCRDFDAKEVIWDFFKTHPKQVGKP
jgi:polyhydroxybutyrate depolymerase